MSTAEERLKSIESRLDQIEKNLEVLVKDYFLVDNLDELKSWKPPPDPGPPPAWLVV